VISSRSAISVVWAATGSAFILGAGGKIFNLLAMNSIEAVLNRFINPAWSVIASLIAAFLAFEVAADLPVRSAMRRAWWLMAASAASAFVRYVTELIVQLWNLKVPTDPIISLRQVPGVIALVLLLASLLLIWISFARMGLGLSLGKRDLLGILAILILLPPIMSFRESLADSGSIYLLFRYLQFSQPFLLAITGAFAVVLLRIAKEAGDGQLARSLRYLAYFLILRLFLMMGAIIPAVQQIVPLRVVRGGLIIAVPWLFTLAIAYRWLLVAEAREALRGIAPAPARTDRTMAGAR